MGGVFQGNGGMAARPLEVPGTPETPWLQGQAEGTKPAGLHHPGSTGRSKQTGRTRRYQTVGACYRSTHEAHAHPASPYRPTYRLLRGEVVYKQAVKQADVNPEYYAGI